MAAQSSPDPSVTQPPSTQLSSADPSSPEPQLPPDSGPQPPPLSGIAANHPVSPGGSAGHVPFGDTPFDQRPRSDNDPGTAHDLLRHRWLWLWPVAALAIMAGAGQLLGPFGALLAGIASIGALTLYLGNEFFTAPTRIAISLVVGMALLAVVYGHSSGWAALTERTRSSAGGSTNTKAGRVSADTTNSWSTATVADLRGRQVRAKDVKPGALRNAQLAGAVFDRLDLPAVDMSGASAVGASFRETILTGASLANARLRGADLQLAMLRRADLRGTDLRGADLRGADLRDSCLRGADLTGARLDGADALGAATMAALAAPEATATAHNWPSDPTSAACD